MPAVAPSETSSDLHVVLGASSVGVALRNAH